MPTDTFLNLVSDKQEKIKNCALLEFANCGYTKASINSIIKEANISRGSFYSYFNDKEDLYLYIITTYFDLTDDTIQLRLQNLNYFDYQCELFNILIELGKQHIEWMRRFLTDSTIDQVNYFWKYIHTQLKLHTKQTQNLRFQSPDDLKQLTYMSDQLIWKSLYNYFIEEENVDLVKQKLQKQLLFLKIGIQK